MLHTVYLSDRIKSRLTDIVMLQMVLLRYALFVSNINEDTCATYLNRHKRFRGRGGAIARWLFSSDSRHTPLQDFASFHEETHKASIPFEQERNEKRQWCKQLYRQVQALLFNQPVQLDTLYVEDKAPAWQKEAAKYLVSFYDYLESKTPFPSYLFSEPDAAKFGRQDFLKDFLAANSDLYVCPVCDESGYYTVIENNIRTDIDHYLPKSLYPHLSCHPYNLIPTCTACNQTVKGTKDPLTASDGRRLRLNEVYLPYRSQGLSTSTYLRIQFEDAEEPAKWIKVGELFPQNPPDDTISQLIDTLDKVYKIPHRWSQNGRVDKISETLFRRMRQFLGDGRGSPLGFDMPSAVYNTLNQLLYYLHQEDQSKDPFAFAMTWILVALLNEEYKLLTQAQPEQNDALRFPLIAELVQGLGQNFTNNKERANFAESLLKLLRGE